MLNATMTAFILNVNSKLYKLLNLFTTSAFSLEKRYWYQVKKNSEIVNTQINTITFFYYGKIVNTQINTITVFYYGKGVGVPYWHVLWQKSTSTTNICYKTL